MSKANLVDQAFDDLAHSLRVLLEADYSAKRGGLLFVDRAEAVGNIETGLTSTLNAFHSLYDALGDHPEGKAINWYDNGALATILTLRNARHHNKANKIRTLYSYHVQEARRPAGMEMYVLVNFPPPDLSGSTFEVYQSWRDLKMLLAMPPKESRVKKEVREKIEHYLGSKNFGEFASYYGEPEASVFFNVVPLLANAGSAVFPSMQSFLTPLSTESEAFFVLFSEPAHEVFDNPDVNCGPFVLPN